MSAEICHFQPYRMAIEAKLIIISKWSALPIRGGVLFEINSLHAAGQYTGPTAILGG